MAVTGNLGVGNRCDFDRGETAMGVDHITDTASQIDITTLRTINIDPENDHINDLAQQNDQMIRQEIRRRRKIKATPIIVRHNRIIIPHASLRILVGLGKYPNFPTTSTCEGLRKSNNRADFPHTKLMGEIFGSTKESASTDRPNFFRRPYIAMRPARSPEWLLVWRNRK